MLVMTIATDDRFLHIAPGEALATHRDWSTQSMDFFDDAGRTLRLVADQGDPPRFEPVAEPGDLAAAGARLERALGFAVTELDTRDDLADVRTYADVLRGLPTDYADRLAELSDPATLVDRHRGGMWTSYPSAHNMWHRIWG